VKEKLQKLNQTNTTIATESTVPNRLATEGNQKQKEYTIYHSYISTSLRNIIFYNFLFNLCMRHE